MEKQISIYHYMCIEISYQSSCVQVALRLGMHNYALELVQGMKTISEFKHGGLVREAKNREALSNQQREVRRIERGMARKLAKEGHKVHLLPESKMPNMRNPDAIVDGKVFEFKRVKSTNIKNIANTIYKASKQGENVFIQLSDGVSLHELLVKLRGKDIVGSIWVLKKNELHTWNLK